MTDTNIWQHIPSAVTRSNNTATVAGYSIPSQTANPQNLSIDEAVNRAKNNASFLSEMISFINPEVEELSKNDIVQELYHDCMNLQEFINEQLWSITDPQQMAALLTANEEVTAALAQYHKSTENEELVAAARKFERMKTEEGERRAAYDSSDDSEEVAIANTEEERLSLKMRPVESRDFLVNSPDKAVRHKPNSPKFTTDKYSEVLSPTEIFKPTEPQITVDAAAWVHASAPPQLEVEKEEEEEDNEDWEIVKKDEVETNIQ